ncbi:MAG: ribonuclease HII [Clostridiales bacterium]|nr:ribonuclease HII [Clostridiales bacterium]
MLKVYIRKGNCHMRGKPVFTKEEKLLNEQRRLYEITAFEREYAAAGYKYIGGADEVGRGPLAGPVVACIVILPEGFTYPGINDSKKVSKKLRAALSDVIKENAVSYAVSEVSESEIDEINILNATKKAMTGAFELLPIKPDFILADAITIPEIAIAQKSVIGGDAKSITIAAASIVAKVYRDEVMVRYGVKYPQYGFERNMGYGTAEHIAALKKYGPCPLHRRSFIRNFKV